MERIELLEKDDKLIVKNLKDFNLTHIFECGQAFRWDKFGESYIVVHRGKVAEFYMDGSDLVILNSNRDDFENIWFHYFDLARDYSEIKKGLTLTEAYEKNESLKEAMDFGYGIRILKQDQFEIIISFIISANNQIPRIKKSIRLICENYGEFIENYKGVDYYTFPSPEVLMKLDPLDLKEVTRVGFRNLRIVETSKIYFEERERFNSGLEEDVLKDNLLSLPGVGPKVCDCILLFAYGKEKTFPVDVWVKRMMETLYLENEISNKEIIKYADKLFGDLRAYAQQYLFYYARENSIGK